MNTTGYPLKNSSTVDLTNETHFGLPLGYIVLNTVSALIYLIGVIIPSAILFLIILHYYLKTKKTPLNLIVINYCIAALTSNFLTGLILYYTTPISLNSGSCVGRWLLVGSNYCFYSLLLALVALLAVTQCNMVVLCESSRYRFEYKQVAVLLAISWAYSITSGLLAYAFWSATNTKVLLCTSVGLVLESGTGSYAIFGIFHTVFAILLLLASVFSVTSFFMKKKYSLRDEEQDECLNRKMLLLPMLYAALFTLVAIAYNSLKTGLGFGLKQQSAVIGVELFGTLSLEFVFGPAFALLLISLNDEMRSTLKGIVRKRIKRKNRVQPARNDHEDLEIERERNGIDREDQIFSTEDNQANEEAND